MYLISVNRVHVRSTIYLLPFIWHIILTSRQAKMSPGFLVGKLHRDANNSFWMITAWQSEEAMFIFRNSGAHRNAMPRLLKLCDEACIVQWYQETLELPDWRVVHERMVKEGRPSKLNKPSPAHLARQIAAPRLSNHFDRILHPAR